ncbi:hypothetical protein DFJ63DRAFT_334918 [Scheffersomyces coipomensis]|uniref:uncharacterized protein n=1 Tax=Scheffersomyces coipomensis TaxID=1788519 RepID=UPI00315D32FA
MTCTAAECVCAKKSTCSCGAQPALKCVCDKAAIENAIPEAESACACGKRNKDACTCGVDAVCDGSRDSEHRYTD